MSKKRRPYVRRGPWWSSPWALGSALGVVALIVAGFFIWSSIQPPAVPPADSTSTVVYQTTHVPNAVFDSVQPASNGLKATGSTTVIKAADGKPEVLYIGGEFCPFCAAERWSLVVALSRFGTFKGLSLTSSSSTDVYPNTRTFTFHGSTYQSDVVHFTPVEALDRSGKPLETLTPEQTQLQKTYDPQSTIPFLLIGGRYVALSSGYQPDVLAGRSWEQIAGDLSNPSAGTTKAIVGEADMLTAAICQISNNGPADVCQSTGVRQAQARLGK